MRSPFITRRRHEQAISTTAHARTGAASAGFDQVSQVKDAHAAQAQAVIDGIAYEYYLASAIYAASPNGNTHQSGVMDGLCRAMAVVTGRDIISTGFQMEHGIPQGPGVRGWLATVDVIDGREVHVLVHDDVREPVADRLDRLRMAALRKDGHPLATILANG